MVLRDHGLLLVLLALFSIALSDVYLHNPRGSNNRLAEKTAERKNANRLFDSQNNDRGGYNTGDRFDSKAGNRVERAYSMQYYGSGGDSSESSKLLIEWTNQHGCGGNAKTLCNIVIQYMCQSNGTGEDYPSGSKDTEESIQERTLYMRDGVDTDSGDYNGPASKSESDKTYIKRMEKNYEGNVDAEVGLHETLWWYDTCRYREANGGLFTADQDLKKDKVGYVTASRTRQNADGDRSGYECSEERDYFPYWQPTLQTEKLDRFQRSPWVDLAWLGDKDMCKYIKANSFNRNTKWRCVLGKEKRKRKTRGSGDEEEVEMKRRGRGEGGGDRGGDRGGGGGDRGGGGGGEEEEEEDEGRKYGRSITEKACKAEGGNWVEFVSFLEVLRNVDSKGDCDKANKDNQRNKIFWGKLRSDDNVERCIVQAPEVLCNEAPRTRVNHLGNADNGGSDGETPNTSHLEVDLPNFPSGEVKRCVLRLRYNISTADYDPWKTDASSNNDDAVIENNPKIDVLGNGEELEMALNTAQTGRTFQDRSHVFLVLPRLDSMAGRTLYNLNVRGKRGNLVQTIPATEYDFVPDRLTVDVGDLVHVQWTGSNSHDNQDEGAAGQGKAGTDRHNMLQMNSLDESYPFTIKEAHFWDNVESLTDPQASGEDIAIGLATSGFYCAKKTTAVCPAEHTLAKKRKLDDTLDNAPASYFGHVFRFKEAVSMFYMCSRNNNFSNRSQKGALWVKKGKRTKKE